jgi:hypothetical protein
MLLMLGSFRLASLGAFVSFARWLVGVGHIFTDSCTLRVRL